MSIVWEPQEKQKVFLSRKEDEVLYGGAAGGGKTDAILVEALRQVHVPHYRGIIFRKEFTQLREAIDRSTYIYANAFPKARYNVTTHTWTFPSGAKIYFGNLPDESARFKYMGARFDFIGFDELTHFTEDEYIYMFSRNRSGGPGTRVYVRATTNPGGIGNAWVKRRFIDVAPPLETYIETMLIPNPSNRSDVIEQKVSRVFIPANVYDNHILVDNNPRYLANLYALPEAQRNALLYGEWDSFDGQVFSEWDSSIHICKQFAVPNTWRVFFGFDWGMSRPYAGIWFAEEPNTGKLYGIREMYGCEPGKANKGLGHTAQKVADTINEIEESDENLKDRRITRIADPAIFSTEFVGTSPADAFSDNGIYFDPGNNKRLHGLQQFHYRLAVDENGETLLTFFDTCVNTIRTLPTLVYSHTNVEDVDTRQEDHLYDAIRYMIMSRQVRQRVNWDSKTRDSYNGKSKLPAYYTR